MYSGTTPGTMTDRAVELADKAEKVTDDMKLDVAR